MLSPRARKRNEGIFILVMGVIFLLIGIVVFTSEEVTCGGKQMTENTICETSVNGISTGDNTLGEQRTRDRLFGCFGIGLGLFGGVAGVRALLRLRHDETNDHVGPPLMGP